MKLPCSSYVTYSPTDTQDTSQSVVSSTTERAMNVHRVISSDYLRIAMRPIIFGPRVTPPPSTRVGHLRIDRQFEYQPNTLRWSLVSRHLL